MLSISLSKASVPKIISGMCAQYSLSPELLCATFLYPWVSMPKNPLWYLFAACTHSENLCLVFPNPGVYVASYPFALAELTVADLPLTWNNYG